MIKISVISYNKITPAAVLSAVFGQLGKTIGRGTDNGLVLADPKNIVSQTQALIKSDGVNHIAINLSYASPMWLNGVEMIADHEYALQVGDEMTIGLYQLRAEAIGAALIQTTYTTHTSHIVPASPLQPKSAELHLAATISAFAPVASAPELDSNVDSTMLIQAFLNGAGISAAMLSSSPTAAATQSLKLTPELMETLGKLLATFVQGTIDLNALRTLVRREAHVDVTQVVVRNNNPLKFFPDAETVLTQMLRKKMPGFMGPSEAMLDAYEDLRAHQVGVVAVMRASMHNLLKRFNPALMQKGITKIGLLDSLFPANHKAKLWDAYTALFCKIEQQSHDDFQMLFGKTFLHTYEKEVDKLKNKAHKNALMEDKMRDGVTNDKVIAETIQRHA
ncbi:MAG: type VI secretion system-associated FHA domain protein TagH [Glaciimonas sp.]|nr:type VI secretion system-associated FHA domain protein TagH [Glaciimonas sp.]